MRPSATGRQIGYMIEKLPLGAWSHVITVAPEDTGATIFIYEICTDGRITKHSAYDSANRLDTEFTEHRDWGAVRGSVEGWLDDEVGKPVTRTELDTFLTVQTIGGNGLAAEWLARLT